MLRSLHRCAQRPSSRLAQSLAYSSRQSIVTRPSSVRPFIQTLQTPFIPRPFSISISHLQNAQAVSEAAVESNELPRFEDLRGKLHDVLVDTITRNGLTTMTEVQARTLDSCLKGVDVVAQAKTGTGKTLGFLVPIVQRILESDPDLAQRSQRGYEHGRRQNSSACDIRAIIISPTRELAEQIAEESRKLTRNTGIKIQQAVGGTSRTRDLNLAHAEGCHILVGTPGRLADILSDPTSGITAPKIQTIVLDEADRLLEAGFATEIDAIQSMLPDARTTPRQNLMYSATVSHEVVDLVQQILRPGFDFAQCVDPNEEPTHERVDQRLVILPSATNEAPALVELIKNEHERISQEGGSPFKAMIFYNAIFETDTMYNVLKGVVRKFATNLPVFTIHSRLSQGQRTQVANEFRVAKSGILITTDVTARGMDFTNVTHVIQMDLPATRPTEYYIHRIGRTARAGKEGQGWLFVQRNNLHAARKALAGMPLKVDESLESARRPLDNSETMPASVAQVFSLTQQGIHSIGHRGLNEFYADLIKKASRGPANARGELVQGVNDMTRVLWGMESPPPLSKHFADKLGLSERHHGIVLRSGGDGFGDDGSSGRDFGGGRFGSSSRGQGRGFGGGRNSSESGLDSLRSASYGGGRDGGYGGGRGGGGRDSGRGSRGFGSRDEISRPSRKW